MPGARHFEQIRSSLLCISALLALAGPVGAAAVELRVPEEHATIQGALDAAVAGDVVLVGPGRYVENVIVTKDVVVRSTDGAAATVIDGNAAGYAVTFRAGVAAGTVLDGFTITNGTGFGGVLVDGVPVTVQNCVITENRNAAVGGGMRIYGGGSDWPRVEVTNTVIENNGAYDGAGVWAGWYVAPVFRNCTIRGNSASRTGGGIRAHNTGLVYVHDSVISGNTAGEDGGGISGGFYGWITLTRTVVSGNTAARYGGGGSVGSEGDLTADASMVVGNSAGVAGGGFAALENRAVFRVGDSTFSGNSAPAGGGLFAAPVGTWFTIWNSIVWGNGTPPVLQAPFSYDPHVNGSDFEGGWAGTGSGNFDADPLFVDPAAGDYHLTASSPCVDRTPGGYSGTVVLDIDRLPRPLGSGLDVGADEVGTATDADGDGWFEGFGECNDQNASINPGAAEIPYDGVDQNCNGMADEDDLDRDGYPGAQDCNDQDPYVNPGAAEINYDGIDQNCDGKDGEIVASWFDAVPHEEVNLALAQCNEASIGGNIIAFAVDEREQGVDFNGDQDTDDSVVGYYDLANQVHRNLRVEGRSVRTDGSILAYQDEDGTLSWYRISDGTFRDTGIPGQLARFKAVSGGRIAFTRWVDGYADPQVCAYDTAKRTTTCASIGGSDATIGGTLVAFRTPAGTIAHFDVGTKTTRDTGIAGYGGVVDGTRIVFRASSGVVIYDVATGVLRETPIKSAGDFSASNGIISLLANEDWYWGDLTGDGDRADNYILMFYDIAKDRLVNTGLIGCCGPDVSAGLVAYDKYEGDFDLDFNGDGDFGDCIQHWARLNTIVVTKAVYEPSRQRLTITATSNIDAAAALTVDGFGPMTWVRSADAWQLSAAKVSASPGTVTVRGVEGTATVLVTAR